MKTQYAGTCNVKQVHPAKNPSSKTIGVTTGSREATLRLGELLVQAANNLDPAFDFGVIINAKHAANKDGSKPITIVSARKS
jgi:hypothetical protein